MAFSKATLGIDKKPRYTGGMEGRRIIIIVAIFNPTVALHDSIRRCH